MRCNKDATVFIYISGHQFPLQLEKVRFLGILVSLCA